MHNLKFFGLEVQKREPDVFKGGFFSEPALSLNEEHRSDTPINIRKFSFLLDDEEQIICVLSPIRGLKLERFSTWIASFFNENPLEFIINILNFFNKGPFF